MISPAWKTEWGRIPTGLDLREERKRGLRDGNFWIWGQSNSVNGAINGLEKTPRGEIGLRKKAMGNIKYLLYYEGGEVYEVSKGIHHGLSMIGHIKRTTYPIICLHVHTPFGWRDLAHRTLPLPPWLMDQSSLP